MFADQVNAPRRGVQLPLLPGKLLEFTSDGVLHVICCQVIFYRKDSTKVFGAAAPAKKSETYSSA
jgi:hypothetical protein